MGRRPRKAVVGKRLPSDRTIPAFRRRLPEKRSWFFHLHTSWLFTVSDHKPLVYPMTMTGLLNLLSGPILNAAVSQKPSPFFVLGRFPLVIFWVWFNFLVFCVGNQRLPDSVKEDSLNKPWRPVPARRLTSSEATKLWYCLHIAVLALGAYTESTLYTVCLLVLGWLYNDCGGGGHPLARNLINACAVVCFALGATVVACGQGTFTLNDKAQQWQWIIGAVVFTTLQIQDLCDQKGDRERGRSTIPIIMGDAVGRWSVVVPMLLWSFFIPSFWDMSIYGYLMPLGIGSAISWRALWRKGVAEDRATYKMWGLWIACLLALPSVS